jgi:ArsR family transcriptional regulator
MRELVKVAKALSDETRIRMLKLLLEKDICVCEMEGIFPLSSSQLSRNLKMLMEAGFLKRWREGKCVVYIADCENCNCYCRTLLNMVRDSFNDSEATQSDRAKLQKVMAEQVREKRKQ